MGGRGSSSYSNGATGGGADLVVVFGGGDAKELPLAGQTVFTGGNKTDTRTTLVGFEDRKHGLGHEEMLMVDQQGFARGYFSGDQGAVSFRIPKHANPKNLSITHNHPLGDGRSTGGTFSASDMSVLAKYGFKEIRATAAEGTYSLRPTGRANSTGFLKALSHYDSTVANQTKASVRSGDKRSTIDIALDHANQWVSKTAPKYGYEYTFTKRSGFKKKNQHGQTSLAFD